MVNASIMKFKVINSQGEVIETITKNLENNRFDNLLVQPKKSGNYSIELTLYNDDGYLQDYYYKENLFVDLNLPDLHLDVPELISETSEGILSQVKGVDINDKFFVKGQIRNLGTINANNVSLRIEYEDKVKIINYTKLNPREIINWTLSDFEILDSNNFSQNVNINLTVFLFRLLRNRS